MRKNGFFRSPQHPLMDFLRTVLVFVGVLSVLVVVHEWGHFIAAKLCGMRVDDFSLFFGKRIWRIGERNGTEYNVRSIPLGGFVKIAGMEPEDAYAGSYVRQPGSKRNERLLAGLDLSDLKDVDEKHISDRVSEAIYNAIGTDSKLTPPGRAELEALVGSEGINDSERRYLQSVLQAAPRPPDPQAYNQKPLLQRASVIFAGPLASLLLGYLMICIMGVTTGLPHVPDKMESVLGMVISGKAAEKAGLKEGDRVLSVNQKPVSEWPDLVSQIRANPGHLLTLKIRREGDLLTIPVTPASEKQKVEENGKTVEKTVGAIGVAPSIEWQRYPNPMISMREGTKLLAFQVKMMFQTIFSRHAGENLSGPIGIAGQIRDDSRSGFKQVLATAASLSISLGVMNLLPIPLLDGGHLMLLGMEGIRRRKLSFQEFIAAQKVGILIIGTIFILVMYNDLKRLLFKG